MSTTPVATETTINTLETLDEIIGELNNRPTDKIIPEEKHTETVKKIVAEHQDIAAEYPPVTKYEYPAITKYEPQRETEMVPLEQLKIKCQQLSRLFGTNNKTSQSIPSRPQNHKYPDIQSRPVYYPTRPTFRPIRYPSTSKPQGFYITSQPSTTRRPPSNTDDQSTAPIKYIRLEPVILQKTILGDGRTVYLWHKSLPTAVEYPANYSPYVQNYGQSGYEYKNQNNLGYSPQHGYYYDQNLNLYTNSYLKPGQVVHTNEISQQVTTESTTTTEDSNSYGYGFSNFIPFYRYVTPFFSLLLIYTTIFWNVFPKLI